MNILSVFISRAWFKSFVGAITVLFILITVGDIVNGFLRGYETQKILFQFILKLPEFIGKTLPICTLLASLFALNKLKAHSELLAILAAGYSSSRVYKILLACAFSVGVLQFINLGYIQPKANAIKRQEFEKSQRNESRYMARSVSGNTGLLWYKSSNYFASFSGFDPKTNELKRLNLFFLNSNNILSQLLIANKATFTNGHWVGHQISHFLNLDSSELFPTINSSSEAKIGIAESPEDFDQFKSDITTLNFFELARFIYTLYNVNINAAEFEIMLYEKISLALICIVFALLPMSALYNPGRRNSSFGKSVVFVLVFSIMFWLSYSSVLSLGSNGKIPPLLASMLIPTVFFMYIVYVYRKNRSL